MDAIKVHQAPRKQRINNPIFSAPPNRLVDRQKKLRRIPHIFSKVLELPFHSDADVFVEENHYSFRFVITTDDVSNDVRAHTIEIYPGVTKIVIRGSNVLELNLGELELLDLWRFRLPATARTELATANYVDGELIVTVPKDETCDEGGDEEGGDEETEIWGEVETRGKGGLVLVN